MSFLEIRNLNYEIRKKKILKEVNIKFEKGEFYSIIGPNGSGKTTFIKHLIRAIENKNSNILLEGSNILGYKARELASKISYVPQLISYEMDFSCFDVVMMGRNYLQKGFASSTKQDIQRVNEAMEITDTLFLKDVSIRDISGGERGRVILARALCQDSECIILDEPLAHLDINHQINVMKILKDINVNKNKTIIMVNHDINLALRFSKKIVLFNKGELEVACNPKELLNKDLLNKVYSLKLKEENINYDQLFINFY